MTLTFRVHLTESGRPTFTHVTVKSPFLVRPRFEAETRAIVEAHERGHHDVQITGVYEQRQ